MNNYYYIIDIPTGDKIQEIEAVIVGKIEQHIPLKNGQLVVKTPNGVTKTPEPLKTWTKYDLKTIHSAIDKIENG